MSRFARHYRVFFYEEPLLDFPSPVLDVEACPRSGVRVVTPCRSPLSGPQARWMGAEMLNRFLESHGIRDFVAWYYTPMALGISRHLQPKTVIYDCMDELSAFRGAPAGLGEMENELFERADLVFTGGRRLYEHKRKRHPRTYLFPSSVDADHFRRARCPQPTPPDQDGIPHPRIGYCGVIDERCDLALIKNIACAKPDWQIILIGPVAKISESSLPKAPNLHYLGAKEYGDLPLYFSGWDAAIVPFAMNEATRFLSPTKTPEYLAAGLPVVSTPIADVTKPYVEEGLVQVGANSSDFIDAIELSLRPGAVSPVWLSRVDSLLAGSSWDSTWREMSCLLHTVNATEQLHVAGD